MLRIVKKTDTTTMQAIVIRLLSIVLALLASALFILILGHDPIKVYISMIDGSIGKINRFRQTIVQAVPLAITSLGIMVAFKMKFWNIGAEGQITMGAFAASYFGLYFTGMPKPLLIAIMMLAGIVAGGIWALIPGFFKARFGANETLFTLMMNYIAIKWVTYLQYGPWKDPEAKGFPIIKKFTENAILPKLFGVHIGWVITLILAIAVHIFVHYTKKGYEISVIGESENTARYAGMNVNRIIITAIMISGGICGLAGMIQVSGVNGRLTYQAAGGAGYTAIIVTWLAQLSAPAIIIVSFLFAMLVQGAEYIQVAFQIPQAAAKLLQGMILFFVLGSEFFIQYKIVFDSVFDKIRVKRGRLN